MKTVARIENPDGQVVAVTITLSLASWKKFLNAMNGGGSQFTAQTPGRQVIATIEKVVREVEKTVTEPIEWED